MHFTSSSPIPQLSKSRSSSLACDDCSTSKASRKIWLDPHMAWLTHYVFKLVIKEMT